MTAEVQSSRSMKIRFALALRKAGVAGEQYKQVMESLSGSKPKAVHLSPVNIRRLEKRLTTHRVAVVSVGKTIKVYSVDGYQAQVNGGKKQAQQRAAAAASARAQG